MPTLHVEVEGRKGGEAELLHFRLDLQLGPTGAEVTSLRELAPLDESELGDAFEVRL